LRKTENLDTDSLKDMDELLKMKIVDIWENAQMYHINNEYLKCYRAYRSMFLSIIGYVFNNKDKIQLLTETLEAYANKVESEGKFSKMNDVIDFQGTKQDLKTLLYEYMQLIQKAFIDLKLWFRSYTNFADFDEQLSMELFNSTNRTINQKKHELRALESRDLLEFLTNKQLHNVYAEMLYQNAKKLTENQ